jgi:hypothetical protein
MDKITRFIGCGDAIEFDFVERQATPKNVMHLILQLYVSELSCSNIDTILDVPSRNRARSPLHNRVQNRGSNRKLAEIPTR